MTALVTGNTRAPLKDRGEDLYETPPCAVNALLRAERLPRRIWECASGRNAIVNVLRSAGHEVFASDIVDYGEPGQFAQRDFLLERDLPAGIEAIVTNPPFKNAGEFVEHALKLCPHVCMLLRLAFLESRRRTGILESGTLARVHIFRERLPRMHRDSWQGAKASSSMSFAWFCWDRDHSGPPTLHRISGVEQ
jgi:hypothetical protein